MGLQRDRAKWNASTMGILPICSIAGSKMSRGQCSLTPGNKNWTTNRWANYNLRRTSDGDRDNRI